MKLQRNKKKRRKYHINKTVKKKKKKWGCRVMSVTSYPFCGKRVLPLFREHCEGLKGMYLPNR